MSLMIVERFTAIGEAEVAAAALDAAGIDVALADDEIVALNWTWSNAVGGVKVVVWWEDLEIAGALLGILSEAEVFPDGGEAAEPAMETSAAERPTMESAPDEGQSGPPSPEDQEQELNCPACGSANVIRPRRLIVFGVIGLLLVAIALAIGQIGLAFAGVLAAALIAAAVPSHQCTECGERWNARGARRTIETGGSETPQPLRPTEDETELWPPDVQDTIGELCPRCGSEEFHHLDERRLKAFMLLFPVTAIVVLPLWPFLPKRRCDACGLNA